MHDTSFTIRITSWTITMHADDCSFCIIIVVKTTVWKFFHACHPDS